MNENFLMSAARLREALAGAGTLPLILDCGFDLAQPQAGRQAYEQGHVPGAHCAHLEEHLSGPKHAGGPKDAAFTGRHPLPDRAEWAAQVGRWGITPQTLVVCYDDQGSPYAARAWWLLRWLGHSAVMVLDGGKAAWLAAGGALSREQPLPKDAGPYPATGQGAMPTVSAMELREQLGRVPLLDARAPERWRGDVEALDPVAGHIPGSKVRFFKDNLQADGRFLPADQLRAAFAPLVAVSAESTIHQCGSGVTACHNLLAMAQAGLGISRLYPGSWSEWCADASRPIARA